MQKKLSPDDLLFFNGINGESGEYGLPPMSDADLSKFIRGEKSPENLAELRARHKLAKTTQRGVKEGVDPLKLEEAGWGIVFPHDADPAVREALHELIELRRGQAGQRFKIYAEDEGFRPKDTANSFLTRNGVGPGPVDPDKMPYYLLLVGDPEQIPFNVQTLLDVQFAVGRIAFDTPDEYARYAHSVVAAETGQVCLERRAAFFGVTNPDDTATQSSRKWLVEPLLEKLTPAFKDWQVDAYLGEQAGKEQLAGLLGGKQPPALLFTSGHGVSFPADSPRQRRHQGALLCKEWPGPEHWQSGKPIPPDFYFAGDDLSAGAGVAGLVAFFFACYGAGTPLFDEFSRQAFKKAEPIAPRPFLADLPMKLLAHPRGGALAVIGHVERAWGCSFHWPGAGSQTIAFESAIQGLLKGKPVGLAFEYFNERYAELSTRLTDTIESLDYGRRADPYELSSLWTANNDARGYVVLGDPFVRLAVSRPQVEPPPAPPKQVMRGMTRLS